MLFLTRLFGVTGSDAERNLAAEPSLINEIVEEVLFLQANSAAQQKRPLGRGTHVKGTAARAQFEVFDVTAGRDAILAARLAKGIFAKPGIYLAIVRFGNADPKITQRSTRISRPTFDPCPSLSTSLVMARLFPTRDLLAARLKALYRTSFGDCRRRNRNRSGNRRSN